MEGIPSSMDQAPISACLPQLPACLQTQVSQADGFFWPFKYWKYHKKQILSCWFVIPSHQETLKITYFQDLIQAWVN